LIFEISIYRHVNRPACLSKQFTQDYTCSFTGARYDSENIESQRCFLASLTESIRELLKQYEGSLVLDSSHGSVTDLKFVDYLKR